MARDRDETQDDSGGAPQQGGGKPKQADQGGGKGGGTEEQGGKKEGLYEDPVSDLPGFNQTSSTIAIAGHPLHAMSVAFPIALTFCNFGADVFYWWTGDSFWARAALWAAGMAFLIGVAAAFTGTLELLFVPGIRARAAAWTHAGIAVVLLSILGANWGYRLYGYEELQ